MMHEFALYEIKIESVLLNLQHIPSFIDKELYNDNVFKKFVQLYNNRKLFFSNLLFSSYLTEKRKNVTAALPFYYYQFPDKQL